VAAEAVARAGAGQGPSLIEVHTVRLWGHFEGDAQAYRGAELETLSEHDPIPRYAARLAELGALDEAGAAAIAEACQARVDAAIDFAKSSPEPAPEAALDHVFA
jgi:pyruvate dehydrogenase E1 component alpha subunit